MKRYNIINNALGWLCFLIAAVTYLLTVEPTASFWDCPEFISQGYKLDIGHPPGNPIFMLTARFFITIFGGEATTAALAVNSMSAILSAGTILLLFWTVTHLVRRLIVHDDATEVSLTKMLVIFGSGVCGAMAYTWSDTFWFSAVEGEVYAFSSFCTALVFWLILKWENRADQPHSDRYLVLIAYVIGISIAVHLLNLLCIPAIVLVIYYRKFKNTTARGSLIALCVAAAIVGLILYGLVPGFVSVAQRFELFTVNTLGMSYNSGVLVYMVLIIALFVWSLRELWVNDNPTRIKVSFILAITFSGIPFIGHGWVVPVVLIAAMCVYFFGYCKKVPRRILSLTMLSVVVMFIGYSSYALLIIRANANPPLNQNQIDNVFSLASYLNREQYGDRPLFYGRTMNSSVVYTTDNTGRTVPVKEEHTTYNKVVKTSPDEPDRYVKTDVESSSDYTYTPELNMLFPRMYSANPSHVSSYLSWTQTDQSDMDLVEGTTHVDADGNPTSKELMLKPTFSQNLKFFLGYQLSYMYWRYFMWNFAGRQNDYQGQGEPNHGNWISGIPVIDNLRLGDQSLLPDELGKGNKGHNAFYMLPLFMGLIGLLWQAFSSKRGIEQFWVIFFLFFMTGIAIVLYLNQTPAQPRERDYAFVGSFYAFAIWLGMGVAGLWDFTRDIIRHFKVSRAKKHNREAVESPKTGLIVAVVAVLIGIFVPCQMVSQTWDDHDRSGRYTARDYGMNYLSSLDDNAIIFVNGDNDTFPLWYAQEVEGFRTDVRVVNLAYLTTPWYAEQQRLPNYEAAPVDMQATPQQLAYERAQQVFVYPQGAQGWVPADVALASVYEGQPLPEFGNRLVMPVSRLLMDANLADAVKQGVVNASDTLIVDDYIMLDIGSVSGYQPENGRYYGSLDQSNLLTLDIMNRSIKDGWKRPVYFAVTVGGGDHFVAADPYLRRTGLAYQMTPVPSETNANYETKSNTEKMYRNVMERFRWGGLDSGKDIYLDETVRSMVTHHRSGLANLATDLITEGIFLREAGDESGAQEKFKKAINVLNLIEEKLPTRLSPYQQLTSFYLVGDYMALANYLNDPKLKQKAQAIYESEIVRYAQYMAYYDNMSRTGNGATLQKHEITSKTWTLVLLLQSYVENFGTDITPLQQAIDKAGVKFNLGYFYKTEVPAYLKDESTLAYLLKQAYLIDYKKMSEHELAQMKAMSEAEDKASLNNN